MLALVLAGALYGATSLAHGSGFLAVFIAGLVLGDAGRRTGRDRALLRRSLASLAELAVFVALGLTIDISGLSGRVWLEGIVLALVCAARPAARRAPDTRPARLTWAERRVHHLERPERRGADPPRRVRPARRRRRRRARLRARFRRRARLGRRPGDTRALRRASARHPDARTPGTSVGAVVRLGEEPPAAPSSRSASARERPATPSATFRSASTPGSRSSSGMARQLGPADPSTAARRSRPAPGGSGRSRTAATRCSAGNVRGARTWIPPDHHAPVEEDAVPGNATRG